jgi:hypothetical protein
MRTDFQTCTRGSALDCSIIGVAAVQCQEALFAIGLVRAKLVTLYFENARDFVREPLFAIGFVARF